MFNSYRYNCRMNFINIEIDTNEFLFEKKNDDDDENNNKRINKNKNAFEFIEINVVF